MKQKQTTTFRLTLDVTLFKGADKSRLYDLLFNDMPQMLNGYPEDAIKVRLEEIKSIAAA